MTLLLLSRYYYYSCGSLAQYELVLQYSTIKRIKTQGPSSKTRVKMLRDQVTIQVFEEVAGAARKAANTDQEKNVYSQAARLRMGSVTVITGRLQDRDCPDVPFRP